MSFWLWVTFAIVFVLAVTLAIAALRKDDDPHYTVFGGSWEDEDTWRKF
jgi:hypothetical protein